MTIRELAEINESERLHPQAALSAHGKGRLKPEKESDIMTAFQRDRDKIIHCKAFRRLKHKTQVFLAPKGDHFRTRLTHTLEVSQIARTIARALRLNEDLTEAIALAHDLGHTPFGHAGESILSELLPDGFNHYEQSLRVVDILERKGEGLNLTFEVRDGILKHSKGRGEIITDANKRSPSTLEGQIVRISDVLAYLNHDLDDAIRAGVIKKSDVPGNIYDFLGHSRSQRMDTMVKDIVYATMDSDYRQIVMTDQLKEHIYQLRDFLFDYVYESQMMLNDFKKAKKILSELFIYYLEHTEDVFQEIHYTTPVNNERAVCDFIAGMTDRFALEIFERLFIPQPW
jgi:dGTPase